MKIVKRALIYSLVFAAHSAWAQATPPPEAPDVGPTPTLEVPRSPTPNKIGLNYRMGLNITADFEKLGGLARSQPGPAHGIGINRTYDDGYVKVDSSATPGPTTWYWGYTSANSVEPNYLVLQSDATLPNAVSKGNQDDPQHGVELTYSRELYRRKGWRAGAEAALGYTRISVSDSHTLKNTAYRTNDFYALDGTIVPTPPPYYGQYDVYGPLMNSEPSSRPPAQVLVNAATISGSRELDADVFLMRLGPYLEIPLSRKFSIILDGGLTLAVGVTDFSFREDVTISDPTYGIKVSSPKTVTGSGSQTDFLVGGYAGGSLAYALTKEISLLAGAQFQAAGRAVNTEKGKEAVLDLGSSIIVSIGAAYSF